MSLPRVGRVAAVLLALAVAYAVAAAAVRRFTGSSAKVAEAPPAEAPAAEGPFIVENVRYAEAVEPGSPIEISVTLSRAAGGAAETATVVPLAVLLDESGREVREASGPATHLAPGAHADDVRVLLKTDGLAPGGYDLAVIPSDPETGRKIGRGVHRRPVDLRRPPR